MEPASNLQSQGGNWATQVNLESEADKRRQPWKQALEAVEKLKQDPEGNCVHGSRPEPQPNPKPPKPDTPPVTF
jgi:hypothetical protein